MTIHDLGLTANPFTLHPDVTDRALAAYRNITGHEPDNYIGFLSALLAAVVTDRGLQDAKRILQYTCVCTHAEVVHDLKGGKRTACSTASGPTGQPCECKVYLSQAAP